MNTDFFESAPVCESPQTIIQIKRMNSRQQKYRFRLSHAQNRSVPQEKDLISIGDVVAWSQWRGFSSNAGTGNIPHQLCSALQVLWRNFTWPRAGQRGRADPYRWPANEYSVTAFSASQETPRRWDRAGAGRWLCCAKRRHIRAREGWDLTETTPARPATALRARGRELERLLQTGRARRARAAGAESSRSPPTSFGTFPMRPVISAVSTAKSCS